MDSQDIFSPNNSEQGDAEMRITPNPAVNEENILELHNNAIENMQKPNVPNINVPEKIIICLDICHDNQNSMYRLADGSSFTAVNMLKRVLDFYFFTKHAINKKTEFALIVLNDTDAFWVCDFTASVREIIASVDRLHPKESTTDFFDFSKVFNIIKEKVYIPDHTQNNNMVLPPRNVVRMIVFYGRSNCVPVIPQEDDFYNTLKKHLYFYTDILLAHEDDCALYKCEEIFDALQDLDNGYSYVFEVSRNAAKIHECAAKLLAHPFERPLQKNTDYSFGNARG